MPPPVAVRTRGTITVAELRQDLNKMCVPVCVVWYTCVRVCVRYYRYAQVRLSVRVRVRVCVHVYVHARLRDCVFVRKC